ncbi:hypothetical protein BZA05DRAFT_385061 [Tricharina praecox]|uniref:uncharacterized protein n=1 Tax=Tricharina praecox TaxID=43433 RepID=UPI00221EF51E|nr:uncharacterized protein BZA05DRAFT_385061 [Tricharina praecox]KAI5857854.1 hypothetical protein BZA05DRAFT_385061 [Tricharina praecox]
MGAMGYASTTVRPLVLVLVLPRSTTCVRRYHRVNFLRRAAYAGDLVRKEKKRERGYPCVMCVPSTPPVRFVPLQPVRILLDWKRFVWDVRGCWTIRKEGR